MGRSTKLLQVPERIVAPRWWSTNDRHHCPRSLEDQRRGLAAQPALRHPAWARRTHCCPTPTSVVLLRACPVLRCPMYTSSHARLPAQLGADRGSGRGEHPILSGLVPADRLPSPLLQCSLT